MILVTGAAGFIGYHLVRRLAAEGHDLVGVDNLNTYYDPQLKWDRLAEIGISRDAVDQMGFAVSSRFPNFRFYRLDIASVERMKTLFERHAFTKVCNLAAQAGVRYSISNPQAYVAANVRGFVNVLENCRAFKIEHLVYASSSSVYGLNDKVPFAETDRVVQPVSLYAATKRSNELLAHVYSNLYAIPTTGLRFFTVYGPWGRPDMAYSLFSEAILIDRPIKVFNHGEMSRDFTYVGDIVEGVYRVLTRPCPDREGVPTRIYNIGKGSPVKLMEFIGLMEQHLGKAAEKNFLPIQPGDVERTFADTSALERDYGYRAATDMSEGIKSFVDWYVGYYYPDGRPRSEPTESPATK